MARLWSNDQKLLPVIWLIKIVALDWEHIYLSLFFINNLTVRLEILKYVNSHTIGCAKYSLCDYATRIAKFVPQYFVRIHLMEQWISGVRDDSFLFY